LAALQAGKQYGVFECEKLFEQIELQLAETVVVTFERVGEDQVQLEHPAPAVPAQALATAVGGHVIRLTMMSLILPIAAVGFKPFGQTSTQFMIV